MFSSCVSRFNKIKNKSLESLRNNKIVVQVFIATILLFSLCYLITKAFSLEENRSICLAEEINSSNNIHETDENLNLQNSDNYLANQDKSIGEYITNNVDESLSKATKCESRNIIWLKQSLIDINSVPNNSTLNSVFSSDTEGSIISTFDMYNVLYDLDEDSEYYVGYINTCDGNVLDVEFAKNNYHGEKINDCIYDKNTGLVYIPKSYTKNKGEDGKESVFELQCQMLISVDKDTDEKIASNVNVSINNNLIKNVAFDIRSSIIKIPLQNVDTNNLVVVADDKINLNPYTSYDEQNKMLYINVSPASINKIDLYVGNVALFNKNIKGGNISNDLPMLPDNYKVNANTIAGGFNYKGARLDLTNQPVLYTEAQSAAPYQDRLLGVQGFKTDTSMEQFKSAIWDNAYDIDVSNISVAGSSALNEFTFWPNPVLDGVDAAGLALKCGHIGTPASYDFATFEVRVELLDVNEPSSYAVIGFCTSSAGHTSQGGCGVYIVKYERGGGVQMNKKSAWSWSEDHPNYSYKNGSCVYSIYRDSACTSWTSINMTVNSDGYACTDLHALEIGTYYVREDQNQHGTNYLWNSEVGSVYVNANTLNWVTFPSSGSGTSIDIPAEDPAPVKLAKADAQTGEPGATEGDVPSFENAHYDYEYYTDYFKSKEDIEAHKSSYQRHWVMSTDVNGLTCVSEQYRNNKVEGDDFYENQDGLIACPLGSYVIHEVKAPDGYLLSDKTYIVQVVPDSSVSWGTKTIVYDADSGTELEKIVDPHTGDIVTEALEQVKKGDYKFVKKEPDEQQTMAYIPWKITSKSTGEWHVVVTDQNGEVNTSSEKAKHTTNTNYFDCLLTNTGEVPETGIDEAAISTFYKSGQFAGTWFCWDKETSKYIAPTESDDNLGALYFDDYYLEELPVTANKGYKLVSRIFNISQDGYVVDGGTITDNPQDTVHITTYAYNFETGDKSLYLSNKETIIDVISYDSLKIGSDYSLVGVLYDKSTLQPLHDGIGNIYTSKTTFTAEDDTGNAYMYFDVDTLDKPNKNIVVYEKLFNDKGELLACHEDITDWAQTVNTISPDIKTYLLNSDGTKEIFQDVNTKLTDYVDYNNLKANKTYYLDGEIINKADGSVVANASKMIVPNASSGRCSIDFVLDTTKFNNDIEFVAFETLYLSDVEVAKHADINDENQTVKFKPASITTDLHVEKTHSHSIERSNVCSVVDTISYNGLSQNNTYKVKGKLIDKKTGKTFIDCSGHAIETEETCITDSKSGTWDIHYIFDSSTLDEGTEIVCYEYVYINGTEIACHEDINDSKQTITVIVPQMYISTQARGGSTESKLYAIEEETLIDRVSYSNVEKGFLYSLTGTLMDRGTGLPLTDKLGQVISVTEHFVTSGSSGQYEMKFKVDTRQLQGRQITVFEKLFDHTGVLRAVHEDLTDDYQSIAIPVVSMGTELLQTVTKSHELQRYADNKIEDIISFNGLCPGKSYYLEGILMDKSTEEPYINEVSGTNVTASLKFVPKEENGKVSIFYTFDSTLMAEDEELVSFVVLHQGKTSNSSSTAKTDASIIIINNDINDEAETVKVTTPKVSTVATYEDGNKNFIARHDSIAHDMLSWKNLPINKEVTAYSWFVYEDSGLPVTDGLIDAKLAQKATDDLVYALGGMVTVCNCENTNRWEVQFRQLTNKVKEDKLLDIDLDSLSHIMYASKKFVPQSNNGEENIDFRFDSAATGAGKITALTVLVSDNTVLASHTYIDDINEQMEILRSNIFTKFADINGNKSIEANNKSLLVDHVEYFTVIPGNEYKLHGKVINKSSGEVVAENEIKLTPEQMSGEIEIPFEIDTSQLSGQDLVCFETLYLDNTEACVHEDINDANQTIHVNGISPGILNGLAKTGDDLFAIGLILLIIALLIGGGIAAYKLNKKFNYFDVYVPGNKGGGKEMKTKETEIDTDSLDIDDTPEEIVEETIDLE